MLEEMRLDREEGLIGLMRRLMSDEVDVSVVAITFLYQYNRVYGLLIRYDLKGIFSAGSQLSTTPR